MATMQLAKNDIFEQLGVEPVFCFKADPDPCINVGFSVKILVKIFYWNDRPFSVRPNF